MRFFNFSFNPFPWMNNDDDFNHDNESSKFVVGGDDGGKILNHCGGDTWMDMDGHLNVRTGDHSWMDMNDGNIFFG